MESRGQKRTEVLAELPADKRACNSLESRPSTSTSTISSSQQMQDTEMESSSSGSSSRSESDGDRDSTHGSYESENGGLREYYRHQERQAAGDQTKFREMISSLRKEEVDEATLLGLLTQLCELLSFQSDESLASPMADSISPLIVKLANYEGNPDIMLLAIRAITYLCDVNPQSSGFLVRHDAVPVLCQKLMEIEYLDVAEQCLQALEKISREQPLACLQSGAIMAVLGYLDFFSTSVQRVALNTVVNICKKLSPESPAFFMDAVPVLCNLLQYDDKKLVESVATSLIKMGVQVHSSESLDIICSHGLVQNALHLIGSNSMALSEKTRNGLIGLLAKLASGSTVASKTLLELNISNTVKEILSAYHLPNGTASAPMIDGHHSQIHEVLKLLNELLPTILVEKDGQPRTDKETYLLSRPDILQKFGVDLLPILIQVVDSSVNAITSYSSLSVINKLVHFSTSNTLHSLLQTTNISSFLSGVFMRKDHHVILLALEIVDKIMLKLPQVFLNSFIKEGVLFAINGLLSPHTDLKLSPPVDGVSTEKDKTKKSASKDMHRCPCFSFDTDKSSNDSENVSCKLQTDTIRNLAKHVWTTYFEAESMNPEKGVTDTLQKLRTLSSALVTLVNKHLIDVPSTEEEKEICDVLHQIMSSLIKEDSISSFEFVESGMIKALVNYLSNGSPFVVEENKLATINLPIMEKRFEVFGRLLLSGANPSWVELLPTLVQRLQSALSASENFAVLSSHKLKMKSSHAIVPHGCQTAYPCMKVQFEKEDGENSLHGYKKDYVTVDPFLPLDDIEEYLWPKVNDVKTENVEIPSQSISPALPFHELQDSVAEGEEHSCLQEDGGMDIDQCEDTESSQPKLLFYWEGRRLNNKLTLYQSILEQQTEVEHDNSINPNSWTRGYKITYRRHVMNESIPTKNSQYCPFSSRMFVSEVYLEKLGRTYDILFLLKSLEETNRLRTHLVSRERTCAFAEGRTEDLDKLNVPIYEVSQSEFVNSKLTEKLEQQMKDPMSVSVGAMPAWCTQLMAWCPFLFGFEARQKYFNLAALTRLPIQPRTSSHGNGGDSRQHNNGNAKKKFQITRDEILESAARIMEVHAGEYTPLEVTYHEEVGTGLGPTLEFYTLVCHEFQKNSLGLWRDNHVIEAECSEFMVSPFGLFPRPWSTSASRYSEVIQKFTLLGQMVAKALQDGRILDLPFSNAFYKLILEKALTVFDIQSIDPAFGRALLEFQAVAERRRYLNSLFDGNTHNLDVCFRSTRIEDLCLDFTLPGYPDYSSLAASDPKMVNLSNLEEYVSLMVDATTGTGIAKQIEAFKSGFNQVFPMRHLKVFTEEELERLLCGEHILWNYDELTDHIKSDHGYTANSPQILNLLEIMHEFDREQQRAFLQFVTGAPRLPTGGLASLSPKLTIVRKHCSKEIDEELPSVMTCANYLKLPPYSSKNIMKTKLLYAITEGQGSFHLS